MIEKKIPAPWEPPDYEKYEIACIQALAEGTAEPEQQKAALRLIVDKISLTYDMSYRPGSERDTAFAEGKRFVGNQIIRLTKLNLSRMKEKS
jgi:hypothetical protein